MHTCPSGVLGIVRRSYPVIKAITWNSKRECFDIFEEVSLRACKRLRRVLSYFNEDGTALPIIGDHAVKLLKHADTRLWPLEERMALFDKEDAVAEEAQIQRLKDRVRTVITEDYHYIAGIPTFFMGDSMQVRRATYRPGQERILRNQGLL